MTYLEMKPEEAEQLAEILWDAAGDLRMEIAGTDSMNLREELKKREAFLRRLVIELRTERVLSS